MDLIVITQGNKVIRCLQHGSEVLAQKCIRCHYGYYLVLIQKLSQVLCTLHFTSSSRGSVLSHFLGRPACLPQKLQMATYSIAEKAGKSVLCVREKSTGTVYTAERVLVTFPFPADVQGMSLFRGKTQPLVLFL